MNKILKNAKKLLKKEMDEETLNKIILNANKRLKALKMENKAEPKAKKVHTFKKIYPAISLHEALQQKGISKDDSVKIIDLIVCNDAKKKAKMLRKLLKCGLYKKYPQIFGKVAKKSFGEDAGFKQKFYETSKNECKFDMTKCLFCDTFRKYHCPELTICFCHTDDINNAHLHEKINWLRTQTLAEGAPCCDFYIQLTNELK